MWVGEFGVAGAHWGGGGGGAVAEVEGGRMRRDRGRRVVEGRIVVAVKRWLLMRIGVMLERWCWG